MSYHQPDPSHAPAPSALQQYELFKGRGGNIEEFAIQMNPVGQEGKIVVMRAFIKGGVMAFLSREINTTKKYTTIPEFSEKDIKELKIKTVTDMERALRDIGTTREILTGNKGAPIIIELDEILGYNSIGHRYRPYRRTSPNLSIPA